MSLKQAIQNANILIVDDEPSNLLLLERSLRQAGHHKLTCLTDSREALASFAKNAPDLVCTDLHMPHLSGIALIEKMMAQVPDHTYLPIIMLTADLSPEAERLALSKGAKDFIRKPFKATQIKVRVHNLLQTRFLHLALLKQNERLEEKVRKRTQELEASRSDALDRLAMAAEYRDETTGQHTQRVGILSANIARALGLQREEIALIRRAAPLHDVGKIGIPDDILLKPDKLSTEEFTIMKSHVQVGSQLLSEGRSELVQLAEVIAQTHHERFDGSGYPLGLEGDEIPLVGQIVALADVFDTLTNERPYKDAWPKDKALKEIKELSGSWFSPTIVEAFLKVVGENPY